MKRIIFLFLLVSIITSVHPLKVSAAEKASLISASFITPLEVTTREQDNRAEILEKFLEKRNSPLAKNAQAFVDEADTYHLDWKFVAAISGVESTFGQAVPYQCNNAWGYNIYGDTTRCFDTYDDAIHVISRDLRVLYMNKWGLHDVYQIGARYAASKTWASRVDGFMQDIQQFANKPVVKNPTMTI